MNEVERGCPVDYKDQYGNTLLNVAAQNGHKSLIKVLT
jgi:ankyrin repeat protein